MTAAPEMPYRPEGAVHADELERLSFTPAGLVHWLVVDVVSGMAARNGQREESEWLRNLPDPATRVSPAGAMDTLTRVRDETTATLLRTWNETNAIKRFDDPAFGRARPRYMEAGLDGAAAAGLWVGAVREARHIATEGHIIAAVQDRRDELHGMPIDQECGWLASFRESVEMDLWSHAQEVTYLPFSVDGAECDFGLLLGGESRWWPSEGRDEKVMVMCFR